MLRYIKGTSQFHIVPEKNDNFMLKGFANADYASDMEERKSTMGYAFTLGSEVSSWASKMQSLVDLSMTQVEFRAAIEDTWKAVWLHRILCDLKLPKTQPTTSKNKTCQNSPSLHEKINAEQRDRTDFLQVPRSSSKHL